MARLAQPEPGMTGRKTLTPEETARPAPCSVCFARPGAPCERSPERDHLARFLDGHANGAIGREAMSAVLARIEVIAKGALVPAACSCCGVPGQSDTPQWPDPDVA